MSSFHVLTNPGQQLDIPEVRSIGPADLVDALRLGWRDFWQRPSHLAFLGLIYPLCGAALALWSSGNNSWPLLFPLISGFALVGPFLALPIYEMSRREELGLDTHWRAAFDVFRSPAFASIAAVGVMMLIAFTVWLMVAQFIYESTFGPGSPATLAVFLSELFNTPQGTSLMIWGNLIGLLFAAAVLATMVVSIPLVLDRDVGAAVAIFTSLRVTIRNPLTIALWGIIVAALLVTGVIPLLVGLAVVVPVLGHATWHLYRKAVVPPGGAR
ncbi:MAG: DUF2189 domain-containing protein [Devosia sp.]|uniref:DUF2189 domain-containing protein n=1 Tax=Devosia sp. TaxID=1871048 RepID=UPI001ACB1F6E|nr:DUF2189 domain-containing protein [Devosia sp.]MBN9316144.1 DUF2189 domain-containing protein [Devosia sp.]